MGKQTVKQIMANKIFETFAQDNPSCPYDDLIFIGRSDKNDDNDHTYFYNEKDEHVYILDEYSIDKYSLNYLHFKKVAPTRFYTEDLLDGGFYKFAIKYLLKKLGISGYRFRQTLEYGSYQTGHNLVFKDEADAAAFQVYFAKNIR